MASQLHSLALELGVDEQELEEAELFITTELRNKMTVNILDLLDHFDLDIRIVKMIMNHFEKRTNALALSTVSAQSYTTYSPYVHLANMEEEIWDDENVKIAEGQKSNNISSTQKKNNDHNNRNSMTGRNNDHNNDSDSGNGYKSIKDDYHSDSSQSTPSIDRHTNHDTTYKSYNDNFKKIDGYNSNKNNNDNYKRRGSINNLALERLTFHSNPQAKQSNNSTPTSLPSPPPPDLETEDDIVVDNEFLHEKNNPYNNLSTIRRASLTQQKRLSAKYHEMMENMEKEIEVNEKIKNENDKSIKTIEDNSNYNTPVKIVSNDRNPKEKNGLIHESNIITTNTSNYTLDIITKEEITSKENWNNSIHVVEDSYTISGKLQDSSKSIPNKNLNTLINNSSQHNSNNSNHIHTTSTALPSVGGLIKTLSNTGINQPFNDRFSSLPVSPKDNIYQSQKKKTWFIKQKEQWSNTIMECALKYGVNLPESIADMIVLDSIIVPGCYSFSGVLFPPQRTETDLFAEYCQFDTGYKDVSAKVANGIQFKRKKPIPQSRRPENNTCSLWLDEDGSICGFRCVWVQGARRQMMLDQKYVVSTGCWALTGEISVSFEQFFAEDVFTGYLQYESYNGQWNAGNEYYGKFQYFVTNIMSYYLHHYINTLDEVISSNDWDGSDDQSRQVTPSPLDPPIEDEIVSSSLKTHILAYSNGDNNTNLNNNPIIPLDNNNSIIFPGQQYLHYYHSSETAASDVHATIQKHILNNKLTEIEVNEHLHVLMHFYVNNILGVHVRDIDRMFHGESEEIGQGVWTNDGVISFENVSYIAQKTILEFHGCTDGEKVVGRLCMYYDESLGEPNKFAEDADSLNSRSPSPLSSSPRKSKRSSNKENNPGRNNTGVVNRINDDLDVDDDGAIGVTDFGGQLAELKLRSSNSKDKINNSNNKSPKTKITSSIKSPIKDIKEDGHIIDNYHNNDEEKDSITQDDSDSDNDDNNNNNNNNNNNDNGKKIKYDSDSHQKKKINGYTVNKLSSDHAVEEIMPDSSKEKVSKTDEDENENDSSTENGSSSSVMDDDEKVSFIQLLVHTIVQE